jgi:hypothetical protein
MSDYDLECVHHGGSWDVFAWRAHAAYRSAGAPSDRFYDVGFRLSRRWM